MDVLCKVFLPTLGSARSPPLDNPPVLLSKTSMQELLLTFLGLRTSVSNERSQRLGTSDHLWKPPRQQTTAGSAHKGLHGIASPGHLQPLAGGLGPHLALCHRWTQEFQTKGAGSNSCCLCSSLQPLQQKACRQLAAQSSQCMSEPNLGEILPMPPGNRICTLLHSVLGKTLSLLPCSQPF